MSVVCSVLIQSMVGGDVPVYAVGVRHQAVGEAGRGSLLAAARPGDEGAVVRGAGGAQRLPRGDEGALADELCLCLLVFLRPGPRKACVGFISPGCPLSCRTAKQGWRKGAACGGAAYGGPQDLSFPLLT